MQESRSGVAVSSISSMNVVGAELVGTGVGVDTGVPVEPMA
jgi:hypothetical protein